MSAILGSAILHLVDGNNVKFDLRDGDLDRLKAVLLKPGCGIQLSEWVTSADRQREPHTDLLLVPVSRVVRAEVVERQGMNGQMKVWQAAPVPEILVCFPMQIGFHKGEFN